MKTILSQPNQIADYALFPLKYQWAWPRYKQMLANFWTPEEIQMAPDVAQWNSSELTSAERQMFLAVFEQVTTFDILRTADITQKLMPKIMAPELIHCLTTQAFQECVHTHSYQYVIESLNLDQEEVYSRYRIVPEMRNRCEYAEQRSSELSTEADILRDLVFFYCIFEGVWFTMNLLGPIQSLARRGLMKGTSEIFQYIARDEQVHVGIGVELITDFLNEHPNLLTNDLRMQIIHDAKAAIKLEDAFIDYALINPVIGYSAEDHKFTARHYAERWLNRLGLNVDFGGEHRLEWIDEMIATKKEKNFFETRVMEYQVGQLMFDDQITQTEHNMGWDNPLCR